MVKIIFSTVSIQSEDLVQQTAYLKLRRFLREDFSSFSVPTVVWHRNYINFKEHLPSNNFHIKPRLENIFPRERLFQSPFPPNYFTEIGTEQNLVDSNRNMIYAFLAHIENSCCK